jgi:alanine transaminase
MEGIVQVAYDENVLLLADEVYQSNIYHPEKRPFVSFKKVLMESPKHIRESVELVSFHSISKGVSGECGRRGGYFECVNVDHDVLDQLYKMASICLCPPVSGQIGVDLLVDPPREGDESYPLYKEETTTTHENLLKRSKYMHERFNALKGVSCQPADGAMYLFPRIDMPKRAIEEAEKQGRKADVMYCLELLGESETFGFLPHGRTVDCTTPP